MLNIIFYWFTPRGPLDLVFKMAFALACIITSNVMFAAIYLGYQPVNFDYYAWNAVSIGLPWLSFFFVISLRQDRAQARLKYLSETDDLTGLNNRTAFFTALRAAIDDGSTGVFMMLDADHFKRVNDEFGHPVGDDVLCGISLSIRTALRPGDIAGRLGGEEFALFLPDTDRATAQDMALRLIGPHSVTTDHDAVLNVTMSIGAIVVGPQFSNLRDYLKAADAALYYAKGTGRCRCVFGDEIPNDHAAPPANPPPAQVA